MMGKRNHYPLKYIWNRIKDCFIPAVFNTRSDDELVDRNVDTYQDAIHESIHFHHDETCDKKYGAEDNKNANVGGKLRKKTKQSIGSKDDKGSKERETRQEKAKPIVCPQCKKRFVDVDALSSHFTSEHVNAHLYMDPEGQAYVFCAICGKLLPGKEALSKHYASAHNDASTETKKAQGSSLVYPVCRKEFRASHARSENSKEKQVKRKDPSTNEITNRPHSLTKKKKKKRITCPDCGKKFATEMARKRHYEAKHRRFEDEQDSGKTIRKNRVEQKSIACSRCGRKFATKMARLSHFHAKHSRLEDEQERGKTNKRPGVNPKSITCDRCGKKFATEMARATHYDAKHERPEDESTRDKKGRKKKNKKGKKKKKQSINELQGKTASRWGKMKRWGYNPYIQI